MTLLLNNSEVNDLIDIGECINVLEDAYKDWAHGFAGTRRRIDFLAPLKDDYSVAYGLKSMDGIWVEKGIATTRINSDIVSWPIKHGKQVRQKIPAVPGKRYTGFILLFNIHTGQLLSIIPDGVIQKIRVGCTSALAAKFLARQDSTQYGLLGSGWQAGAQLWAAHHIFNFKKVLVYSPNPENCAKFAREWCNKLQTEVIPVDTPEKAAEGSDMLSAATNSLQPVFDKSWCRPGMHLSTVKIAEISGATINMCDLAFLHTQGLKPEHYYVGSLRPAAIEKAWDNASVEEIKHLPELVDLFRGNGFGRCNQSQITCFINNMGIGLQFTAVAQMIYQKAIKKRVGTQVPLEWFSQVEHT